MLDNRVKLYPAGRARTSWLEQEWMEEVMKIKQQTTRVFDNANLPLEDALLSETHFVLKPGLKMVRFRFVTERWSLGSWLIRWFTWSRYSHVDVLVPPDDPNATNVIGNRWSAVGARMSGGVLCRELEYARFSRVLVMGVVVTEAEEKMLYRWLMEQVGKRYDILAILNFGLHRRLPSWDRNRWFCSEMAAAGMKVIRHPLLNWWVKVFRTTPEDLLKTPYGVDVTEDYWKRIVPENRKKMQDRYGFSFQRRRLERAIDRANGRVGVGA